MSLSDAGIVTPTFNATSIGVFTFTLTVTDPGNLSDTDDVVVTVVNHLYRIYLPLTLRNH